MPEYCIYTIICSTYGGKERFTQGFGGETRGKEII
jgi:hypothetical protein